MLWYLASSVMALIASIYLFQDMACEKPMPGVGLASATFFIAAILCLK